MNQAIVAALKRIGFDGDLMLDVWLYPLPAGASGVFCVSSADRLVTGQW